MLNTGKGIFSLLSGGLLLLLSMVAEAERIKDITSVAGVRSNPLIGYGLVVGLNGSGGKSLIAERSLKSLLSKFGIQVPDGVKTDNIAPVMVHAELPPFAKLGQQIDVTVSALGKTSSLVGGSLLMTQLRGADQVVYAVAQGSLVVSGFGVAGQDGSRVSVNVPVVGRIPNGASVEQTVPTSFVFSGKLRLNLHQQDFTTATNIATAVNKVLGEGAATAVDSGSVHVSAPRNVAQQVAFLSMVERIDVDPGEAPAKVIINSRTGTVVISRHVRVGPAAISHGSLVVTIREDPAVVQPEPLSGGETALVPESGIAIEERNGPMFLFDPGTSLNDIVEAVNRVGAAPGDLVAILEALKEAGALRAELMVI